VGMMRSALGYFGLSAPGDSHSERGTIAAPRNLPGVPAVASRLVLRGEVSGEGDFQILGKFEGEINVSGKVFVGEGAEVDANINAAAIQIGGVVRGNLSATTRVEILPSGVLTGTLKTGSFSAADGASVKGEIWVARSAPSRPASASAS
jgi:cytoskeletal protein CcmA (bactofilin family)